MVLLVSCGSDETKKESNKFMKPPSWIIGTWQDLSDPDWSRVGGFQFISDNMIDLNVDGSTITNLKNGLQAGVDNGSIVINENSSSTAYSVEIVSNGTVTNSYKFTKGSNNTIVYKLTSAINIVMTKE